MSRVLVDTSVWIEMFRGRDSRAVRRLGGLLRGGLVCTHGLIRAEILSGAKSSRDYDRLEDLFSAIPAVADPPALWDRLARARFLLARRGHQAAVADLVVALAALHHRKTLFTLDAGFRRMLDVLPIPLLSF